MVSCRPHLGCSFFKNVNLAHIVGWSCLVSGELLMILGFPFHPALCLLCLMAIWRLMLVHRSF